MAVSSAPDLGWPVKPAQDHGVCVVAAAGYQPINALLAAAAACMSPRLSWPEAGNEAPGEVATWWVVHFVARTLKEFIFLWPGGWWLVEEKIHPTEHLENKHWRISKTLINEQEGCTRHRAGGSKKKRMKSEYLQWQTKEHLQSRAVQLSMGWRTTNATVPRLCGGRKEWEIPECWVVCRYFVFGWHYYGKRINKGSKEGSLALKAEEVKLIEPSERPVKFQRGTKTSKKNVSIEKLNGVIFIISIKAKF